tara:strand:+ start:294 stop:554 length:261 start_codon:yes stop_codon:yes gene_type:complete
MFNNDPESLPVLQGIEMPHPHGSEFSIGLEFIRYQKYIRTEAGFKELLRELPQSVNLLECIKQELERRRKIVETQMQILEEEDNAT